MPSSWPAQMLALPRFDRELGGGRGCERQHDKQTSPRDSSLQQRRIPEPSRGLPPTRHLRNRPKCLPRPLQDQAFAEPAGPWRTTYVRAKRPRGRHDPLRRRPAARPRRPAWLHSWPGVGRRVTSAFALGPAERGLVLRRHSVSPHSARSPARPTSAFAQEQPQAASTAACGCSWAKAGAFLPRVGEDFPALWGSTLQSWRRQSSSDCPRERSSVRFRFRAGRAYSRSTLLGG